MSAVENIIASVSAAAGIAAAAAAWVQAVKARNAARDAEEALAIHLRPDFVPTVPDSSPDEEVAVGFTNMARHDAVDVHAEVWLDGGTKVGEGGTSRAPGYVPGTWSNGPAFYVQIKELPALAALGDSYELVMILRFTDERGMKNWRQELRVTRTLTERHDRPLLISRNHLSVPIAACSTWPRGTK